MTGPLDRLSTTLALLAILTGLAVYQIDLQPVPSIAAPNPGLHEGPDQTENHGPALQPIPALPKLSDAFVERPLFNANRQKIEDKQSLAAVPEATRNRPAEPQHFKILGIFGLDGRSIALIRQGRSQQTRKIRVGDQIDGWRVEGIDGQGVTLKHGDHQLKAALYPKFDIAK